MNFAICFFICVACFSVGYFNGRKKGHNVCRAIICAAYVMWVEKRPLCTVSEKDMFLSNEKFNEDFKRNDFLERVL